MNRARRGATVGPPFATESLATSRGSRAPNIGGRRRLGSRPPRDRAVRATSRGHPSRRGARNVGNDRSRRRASVHDGTAPPRRTPKLPNLQPRRGDAPAALRAHGRRGRGVGRRGLPEPAAAEARRGRARQLAAHGQPDAAVAGRKGLALEHVGARRQHRHGAHRLARVRGGERRVWRGLRPLLHRHVLARRRRVRHAAAAAQHDVEQHARRLVRSTPARRAAARAKLRRSLVVWRLEPTLEPIKLRTRDAHASFFPRFDADVSRRRYASYVSTDPSPNATLETWRDARETRRAVAGGTALRFTYTVVDGDNTPGAYLDVPKNASLARLFLPDSGDTVTHATRRSPPTPRARDGYARGSGWVKRRVHSIHPHTRHAVASRGAPRVRRPARRRRRLAQRHVAPRERRPAHARHERAQGLAKEEKEAPMRVASDRLAVPPAPPSSVSCCRAVARVKRASARNGGIEGVVDLIISRTKSS